MIDISQKKVVFPKTSDPEFLYNKVWFTDHNCKSLEIEDKINIPLFIN